MKTNALSKHPEPLQTAVLDEARGPEPLAGSPQAALRELFGFDDFRPGQRRIIDHLAGGADALVVMPTGSGKSLCYQLPALSRPGVALVFSPLIALMQDQVDALRSRGLPATYLNSTLKGAEQHDRLRAIAEGRYKIVYVAPERLRSPRFRTVLDRIQVSLLAVDEAHCVSQWGHDFRPDYLRLAALRRYLGDPQTVALTATATAFVQKDILRALGMEGAATLVSGFERPNLAFEVIHADGRDAKLPYVIDALEELVTGEEAGGSAIVYCATRKSVEAVQADLAEALGVGVGAYHGGMGSAARVRAHEAWMRGESPVLVATNAFGMGVDKPDVRAIVHYHMPGSVEAYYQEAGRAGRDGAPARCVLVHSFGDDRIHRFFTDNTYPARADVEAVWRFLARLGRGHHFMTGAAIAEAMDAEGSRVHQMAVDAAIRLLKRADLVRRPRRGVVEVRKVVAPDEIEVDWEGLRRRRAIAERQLDQIKRYVDREKCRQAQLLLYFEGEVPAEPCGRCDVCRMRLATRQALDAAADDAG